MYKPLLFAILTAFLIGCSSNGDVQDMAQDQPMQQDPFQQEQPMADVQVSDEELETFVEVNVMFRDVQMDAQDEMLAILEDEEITVESYNQIAQGLQMGQTRDDIDVSAEELDKFDSASESVAEIEQRLDSEFEDAIADAGLSMDRFQEINMAIQQNPELMQRVQQMIQQEAGMEPQAPTQPPAEY